MTSLFSNIENALLEVLSEKRLQHTLGVVESATRLADIYNQDMDEAKTAALLHDYAKDLTHNQMSYFKRLYNIKMDEVIQSTPELQHGIVAARIAEDKFRITNKNVLNAIEYHTTGRIEMTKLEKIIYLADFIEPNRDYKGVDELRKVAIEDLDKAVFMALSNTIIYVVNIKKILHPNTLHARNYMLKNIE
ncbi:bis(5'-nucleosyl)-tetraphosphatase (symmetrical) YqeK [Serpentinicella sp. ANB-PHB4]|uniref:bis(5'-nucleosyl)-tetraphosphatase (symmetrical) YqeK n=1 Tax=Serpentinicella sp. ANB-PHB4 TaxID=3074076 RepID=UPI00286088B6|nr:bis(5'-nucleosyl)-tetraphosphatase (symmetrical) YqeK [Serpentinicella sp. ANB-PHB4]MDR5658043.1 bis(5'-nucleosyl)-tetraphosphatase (symmetrical) YqeK [Serpentinicella sp. ANB-PHB4]